MISATHYNTFSGSYVVNESSVHLNVHLITKTSSVAIPDSLKEDLLRRLLAEVCQDKRFQASLVEHHAGFSMVNEEPLVRALNALKLRFIPSTLSIMYRRGMDYGLELKCGAEVVHECYEEWSVKHSFRELLSYLKSHD